MRQSTARLQQQAIDSGFLDLTGDEWSDFQPLKLDALADALTAIAVDFATLIREKIESVDKIATGALADSIVPTQVQIFGSVYHVEIQALDYYKFINEGVKGWQNTKASPASPYQFKNTPPSKKMMEDIRKWVIREGLKGRASINRSLTKHGHATRRETARSKITDTSTATAYSIATAVKKFGLPTTHFLNDAITEMEQRTAQTLGLALKTLLIQNLSNGSRNK